MEDEDQNQEVDAGEIRREDWADVWREGMMRNEIDEVFWDDISGKQLSEEGVRKARREEMGELAKHAVTEGIKTVTNLGLFLAYSRR